MIQPEQVYISDTHFGDGSGADDFHRDKEFIEFTHYCNRNNLQLVILGDIYELWQAHLEKIWWAHEKAIKAITFMRHPTRMIYGNHDYLPYSKFYPETFENGYGVMAQHGHQYDIYNSNKNPLFNLSWPIGKYITVGLAALERWVSPDADRWASRMRDRFGDFKWTAANIQNMSKAELDSIEKAAFDITNPLGAKSNKLIYIAGHTHKAKLVKFAHGGIYANCGTWVDGHTPTYVHVRGVGEVVELKNALTHEVIKYEETV